MEPGLTRAEERVVRGGAGVPEPLLAPLAPAWPTDCHAWKAMALSPAGPPKLADCAPEGTKVAEHDKRLLYCGQMHTVRTPAISKALRITAEQIIANRQRQYGRAGIIVEGPRGTGKSALLQAIGVHWEQRLHELYEPDENRIPVIALSVPPPVRGNARDWAGAFARFLGQERDGKDPTESVIRAMRNARTLLVLIDNVERLRSAVDAELTFQYLETISEDTGATFVYCGRGARSIVDPFTRDLDVELAENEEPWGDHMVMRTSRYGFSDEELLAFTHVVDLFDKELPLYRHKRRDLTKLAPVLHKRSRGYLRALSQLICQAAQRAILTGQEKITADLLDQVSVGRVVQL